MKFGCQLELNSHPEWRENYIQYNKLKKFIEREASNRRGGSRSASRSGPGKEGLAEGLALIPGECLLIQFLLC